MSDNCYLCKIEPFKGMTILRHFPFECPNCKEKLFIIRSVVVVGEKLHNGHVLYPTLNFMCDYCKQMIDSIGIFCEDAKIDVSKEFAGITKYDADNHSG